MIDTVLNLLFRCRHSHLTRPVAPATKAGQPKSQSYVVCLDCGKQFEYDLNEMHMGKPIDHSHDAGIVPPNPPKPPKPRNTKLKFGLLAAVPMAFLIGAVLKSKNKTAKPADLKGDSAANHE